MEDYIIVAVLIAVLVLAVLYIVKRKRSKASCCGSGTYVARSRRLPSVAVKRRYRVEGMHCQSCVNRVIEAVQSLDGTSATVDLRRGILIVSMEVELDDSTILSAVEKQGYAIRRA